MAIGALLLVLSCGGPIGFADDRDLSDDGFDRAAYETGVAASRGQWDEEKTWAAKDATHEVEQWDDLATWQSRDD
jgi:hypothetical protein